MSTIVQLTGAQVHYDGRPALTGVDLHVESGEVVAILGANGSGKSTLVRALLGLVPLSAGRLELFGLPLSRTTWHEIGYVPQRSGATSGVPATVQEVVMAGRLPLMRRLRRTSPADRAAVAAALATVGLRARAQDSVATLSGGQQQRVLIARALTCSPRLLVMDEPTSGVDLASQERLTHALAPLVADGLTILLVAHELGPMHPLVTRAVTMSGGGVLHDGPPPEPDHLHLHDPEHAHPVHAAPRRDVWGLS